MRNLRIPLRVVFYKDEGAWIAHCLEFDLLGDGASRKEALKCLTEAISLQVQASLQYENMTNLFKAADPKYLLMFAAGKNIVEGELHIKIDSVTIDDAETREYTESDCEDEAGLAIA